MPGEERKTLLNGALTVGIVTGGLAYFQYREFIKKEFYRSEGHYKFSQTITNCTPWK
jgi:hypothetical protein